MAAIVNARDLMLQAVPANQRVASVSMASNLVVDQSQVTGLGIVVDGTKLVWLAATTQVFQIAKSGTVSPASTTLTANIRNLTNAPTLTVVSGTITPAPTLVNGVVTIQNTHLTTDTATLRLTVTENNVTYTDEITIVKVREGIDSLNGFLTNESHTITADYLGNPLSYSGANGLFKVFQGTVDVSAVCTYSIPAGGNPDALTVNLTASGVNAGTYSVTGGFPIGKELVTVTMRATFGTATMDKVLTIAKAKAATPSKTLHLTATSQVFQIAKSGTVTPASISFTPKQNNLGGTLAFSASPAVTFTTSNGVATLTYAQMGANDAVTITATQDGFSDQITVVKVREGTDTIISVLSNEAHVIPTDSSGNNGNYTGANTLMSIYEGATDVSSLWTYTMYSVIGMTGSLTASGGANRLFTVGTLTADSAYADIQATRTGYPTQMKRFTVTKAKAGVNGTNGSNGQRGSRTFYVALSGATNTFSDSLATTTAQVDGGVVLNDTVTQYNNGITPGFSQTKFWNGSSWVVVNAVVDGNLLVIGTVGTTHLAANAVTAGKISVTTLSAIQASLGTAQIDASGYLRTSGATAYGTGNGIWMGNDAGAYKFRAGTPGGNGMFWDGANLTINGGGTFTGALSAASGTFAGDVLVGGVRVGNLPGASGWQGFVTSGKGFWYDGVPGLLLAHIANYSGGLPYTLMEFYGNDSNLIRWYHHNGQGSMQIKAGGMFSLDSASTQILNIANSKFTVDSSGNVVADTVNIKRRIVLETGTLDPAITVYGTYQQWVDNSESGGSMQTINYTAGTAIVVEIPDLFLTSIYDSASLAGDFNQPFGMQVWPNSGGLRNWTGASGSTFSFHMSATVAPVRAFSNTGMYGTDGRISFKVRLIVRIESGSFTSFTTPPFTYTLYRL